MGPGATYSEQWTSSARSSMSSSHLAGTPRQPAACSSGRSVGPGSRLRRSPPTGTGSTPRVLDELLPAAFHDTEVHANNALETDHGRLKARLRAMRGLKRDRTASVIVAGHAFVQNLRRGFYDLGTDVRPALRVADAFAELTLVI